MYQLNSQEVAFPNPELYHPKDGLMACGGQLSSEWLLFAYQTGLFPWFNEGEPILWWCPDPRFVLFPTELKVSKSMRKLMRDQTFHFSENQNFEEVILNCQNIRRPGQEGTWISDEMLSAYLHLHKLGIAKSVEVWQNEKLVGGFYGVEIGTVFCGESMFRTVSNASKAGFIHFVRSHQFQYELIDCQVYSEHLKSLGARMISKLKYLSFLKKQK